MPHSESADQRSTPRIDLRATPDAPAVAERPLALRFLAAGVPLSLLMDLADPLGPDSIGIYQNESEPPRVVVLDVPSRAAEVAS
ncbi:MAG: hypothetical protein JWM93_1519 [Frankiales bacterium]|nr:hypothetical protein [Frankiales bacterium]